MKKMSEWSFLYMRKDEIKLAIFNSKIKSKGDFTKNRLSQFGCACSAVTENFSVYSLFDDVD